MGPPRYGLLVSEGIARCPKLGAFFDVVATAHDRAGLEYASIVQAKEFPFTGGWVSGKGGQSVIEAERKGGGERMTTTVALLDRV